MTIEFWNLLVAAIALIVSITALRYSHKASQLSKTIYDQSINPQLEIYLEDGIWNFDQPLMLHITNLGEASVQKIDIRTSTTLHQQELGMWVSGSPQPFSLLGSQSSHAKRSIDVSKYLLHFLVYHSGVLKHAPESGITLEAGGEKAIIVVRFQCSWQSAIYNVRTENSLVKYYCLRAWTAFQRLPFDKDHLQWYVSNYDIENNKPSDFYD